MSHARSTLRPVLRAFTYMFLLHLRPWTSIMTGPEDFVRVHKTDMCITLVLDPLKLAGKFSLFALLPTHSCGEGFAIAVVFTGIAPLTVRQLALHYPASLSPKFLARHWHETRHCSHSQFPSNLKIMKARPWQGFVFMSAHIIPVGQCSTLTSPLSILSLTKKIPNIDMLHVL